MDPNIQVKRSGRRWSLPWALAGWIQLSVLGGGVETAEAEQFDCVSARRPQQAVKLFDGRSLDGWQVWLKQTADQDPQQVFSAEAGWIRATGTDNGYIATRDVWRDYHLSFEYRWGRRAEGAKYVRNSGVLLHAVGDHGNARGTWMTSIECQLAQGCEGDLIVIRGKDADGEPIPATLTSRTRTAEDGRTRWDPQGKPTQYSGRQFWWSRHQPGFKERIDTRGAEDVASPLGEWTRVECVCRDRTITIRINGVTVNRAFDVYPACGRILLQSEGHEVLFRSVELKPLAAAVPQGAPKDDR